MNTISRRAFIRITAVGLPALLAACGGTASVSSPASAVPASSAGSAGGSASAAAKPATSAAAKPATSGGATTAGVKLPTYVAFQGPQPDIPGNDQGLPPAYYSYPKNPVKSVPQAPGKGGDVSMMTFTIGSPVPPVSQNPAWQEINKQLGVNLTVNAVGAPDYMTKLNTVMASGGLPDLFYVSVIGASPSNMPEFLQSSCADLTPYVSGDAVKAYPNIAAFPSFRWAFGVFGNKILTVPAATITGQAQFAKGRVLDEAGISGNFKDKDDFMKAAKQLTIPGKQYALEGTGSGYNASTIAAQNPLGWFLQVFRVPNDWRNDGGKLTKDIETPEFKEAVAYVRSLWDAGVIHPDSPSLNLTTSSQAWYAGKSVLYQNGYSAFSIAWDRAVQQDPDFRPRILPIFGADGGKGAAILGVASDSLVAFKQGSADRVKELLGILNFMVAPFGTQENLLLNYGVKDRDYTLNEQGNPMLTKQGQTEVSTFPVWKLSAPPPVLFDGTGGQQFAKEASAGTAAELAIGVKSPVYGLYSKTAAQKDPLLYQKLTDGLNSIIYGRADISTLDGLIQDWRTNGGDQIRTELQQALQDSTK